MLPRMRTQGSAQSLVAASPIGNRTGAYFFPDEDLFMLQLGTQRPMHQFLAPAPPPATEQRLLQTSSHDAF